MFIEQRKSFQIATSILSLCLSLVCWLIIRPYIPKTDSLSQFAFALLLLAAMQGFVSIFKLLLPLAIAKIWPQLEATVDTPKKTMGESL